MLREATDEEFSHWDQLIIANPDGGNVLQIKAFGEVKAKQGWATRHLMIDNVAVLALVRHIPILGELWYLPKGPGVTDVKQLQRVIKALQTTSAFMIKIDPEIPASEATDSKLSAIGLRKTRNLQYNASTVIVNLAPSEDDILASFKQKTRYNIRLAMKKGVTVEAVPTDQSSIDQMYELYGITAHRAGVYLRDKQYFTDYWSLHAGSDTGQMFFAYYEGMVLAGAFVTYLGKKGLYKDGGSIREHTDVQAPYLLQWEMMRWLKGRGVTEYDLHGVPPADQIDNHKHPLAGLARFKTGFSAEVVEYIGTYDIVRSRASYAAWRACGERLCLAYWSRVKKQLFY